MIGIQNQEHLVKKKAYVEKINKQSTAYQVQGCCVDVDSTVWKA